MNTDRLLELSLFLQVAMAVSVATVVFWRGAQRIFPQLTVLLLADVCVGIFSLSLLYFRPLLHVSIDLAYPTYYWGTWFYDAFSTVVKILIVYSVFSEAMRPMAGLHQAGKLIFRWVGVVSALVALALVAGPGVFSTLDGFTLVFNRLQQGVSVLTLCLLVFVCFAVRPLGLTFRSHLFGVSLGLGITSTVELVQAAWQTTSGARSVYSPIYLFSSLGFCAALAVWGTYFAMPEPARRMILLPTTSPFFFWNRISEVLGDAPGHVAVAGFTPSMLAPAEIEMLTAATSAEDSGSVTPAPLGESHRSTERELLRKPDLSSVRPSLAL